MGTGYLLGNHSYGETLKESARHLPWEFLLQWFL